MSHLSTGCLLMNLDKGTSQLTYMVEHASTESTVRHATLPKRGGHRLRGAWSDCRSALGPCALCTRSPSLARRCPALDAQACASTRACEARRLLQLEADCATYACAAELCRSGQSRLRRAPTAHGWSGDSHFALLARPRSRQANFPGRRALLQLATQRAPDSRRWRPGHQRAKRAGTGGGDGGGTACASQDLKTPPAGEQARDACNGTRPGKGPKAPPARAQGPGGGSSARSSGGAQDSLDGAH